MTTPIVLHLPHASTLIPEDLRDDFLLGELELQEELNRITDHATDRIFLKAFPEAEPIVFPVSRLVVDPERFFDDFEEPMSQVGMGVLYTRGSLCQPIRQTLSPEKRQQLLERFYIPHHQKLTEVVENVLQAHGHCLIIDGHSYPAVALTYELQQKSARPDFCLGTDDFHTPEELIASIENQLSHLGYSTARNEPFSGTIVPMKYYQQDQRVQSLMIEINRGLYLQEDYSVDEAGLNRVVYVLREIGELLKGWELG